MLNAHDGAHVLTALPLRANCVHHLANYRLPPLVGVEHLRVDLDRHPTRAVFVVRVTQQFVLAGQVLKEPGRAPGTVGHAQQHRTRAACEVERAGPLVVVLLPGRVDARDRALAGAQVLLLRLGAFHQVPQVQVDASLLVGVGKPHHLDQPGLEGVVDREVAHEPLVKCALGLGRAGAVPGRRGEIEHQGEARGLRDALEDTAPFDVARILAFLGALLTVDVVRLVVDDDDVAPSAKHPPDSCVRILPGAALHRTQDRLGDKPTVLEGYLAFADPVVALPRERDALPVAHQHVRPKLLTVLRRHDVEAVVEVVLARRVEPVATRHAAHPVAHREVGHEH